MQEPEQFLMGRPRRILFALLATSGLALAAGLFFAHQPTPHTEIVWLSPAQTAQAFMPSPWARLQAGVWKVTTQLLPFLRSSNRPDIIISIQQWQPNPTGDPPRPPLSTNAQGVLTWEMFAADVDSVMIRAPQPTFGVAPAGYSVVRGAIIRTSLSNAPTAMNMVFPSGSHHAMWVPNSFQVVASATCVSGFTQLLIDLTPVEPSTGSSINTALRFRALVPDGGGLLFKSMDREGNPHWLLISAETADNSGKRIVGGPTPRL